MKTLMEPLPWTECFRAMNELAGRTRLSWPEPDSGGFNCHPDFTITDVWGAFAWIVTAPGDWLLNQPQIAQFFELETPVVGHWSSWVFGLIFLMSVVSGLLEMISEFLERNDSYRK